MPACFGMAGVYVLAVPGGPQYWYLYLLIPVVELSPSIPVQCASQQLQLQGNEIHSSHIYPKDRIAVLLYNDSFIYFMHVCIRMILLAKTLGT
jgi:hypothetical protein